MKNFDFKTLLPKVLPVLIMMILSAVLFGPEFNGQQLNQSDIRQFKGMSQEIVEYREANGEEPLWTNSMFGGMPAYQISTLYPNPLLQPVDKLLKLGSSGGFGKVFLYMLSFYLLCMALRLDPWLGLLGAIAFGLSSYHLIILEAGHNSKAVAIGYLPGVVAGFLLLFRERKYVMGTVVTTLFLGLQLMSNHPQITYYMLLMLVIVGIAYAIHGLMNGQAVHIGKALGLFALGSVLALGTSASRLMTTLEYSPSTIRGPSELTSNEDDRTDGLDIAYATAWSQGIGETWTLLVPNFHGGASGLLGSEPEALEKVSRQNRQMLSQNVNRYWGDLIFTSGPVYIGALIILLALLGFVYVEGPLKWGMLIALLLTIALAWGKNFMPLTEFFLKNVPMYNKFRAVSMILVVAEFILPLMAVLGVNHLVKHREEIQAKPLPLYLAAGGTVGVLLLMLISPTLFTDFFAKTSRLPGMNEYDFLVAQLGEAGLASAQIDSVMADIEIARRSIFSADVWRSLIITLLGSGLLVAFVRGMLKPTIVIAGLALITLFDLWTIDRRYINEDSFVKARKMQQPFSPSAADQSILADPDPHFRVWNTGRPLDKDAGVSYFHSSLGGYHGAKLRRYQEVIDAHITKNNRAVIDMLNTRYIITGGQQGQEVAQRNPQAMGNAWFVDEMVVVPDADAEIKALDNFEPSQEAIAEERWSDVLAPPPTDRDRDATIALTGYDLKEMVYTSKSSTDQLAVFSEIYYQPGWNAYIDEEPVEHARVNYVLRGLNVPAGEHTVVFRFEPSSYSTGNTIVYISSALMLLLIGFGLWSTFKKEDGLDSEQLHA